MATGRGFDIHKRVAGRPLLLGGLEIAHPKGIEGHSDGDVLLLAVIDALLGAAGKGDIGDRFPDSDPKFKDIASSKMLVAALREVGEYRIVNVDVTLLAEEPKLGPRKREIAANVSRLLGGAPVNVKAKTSEGLGAIGRREAIACFAVVELQKT